MLSGIQRAGDLEILEDHEFQRKTWTVQRYGWAIMGGLVLLGLIGLFGPGPLSDATVGDQGGPLVLRYQRFVRFRSRTRLEVDLRPGIPGVETRLWLSRDYLEGVELAGIEPEPERVEAGADRSAYVIRLAVPGRPVRVSIDVRPDTIGRLEGRISVDGSPPLRFTQFVYP